MQGSDLLSDILIRLCTQQYKTLNPHCTFGSLERIIQHSDCFECLSVHQLPVEPVWVSQGH